MDNTRWKRWFAIVLIFVSGIAVGAASAPLFLGPPRPPFPPTPESVQEHITSRLTRELDLDEAQQKTVSELVHRSLIKGQAIRMEVEPRFRSLIEDTHLSIRAVLDPDQQQRLDAFHERLEERRRGFLMPPPPPPMP
ncbi:hypothetical protein [Salidesulfovibrio brasiliensis]|uniref:hypothetical protein n=1 Tax=Salidesulfovibrio brasiliensis TaxID=221711 RepID=UPI0006D0CDBB|nr:hypothetical protein [Salidesulfovibrio brasiliensis]